ncbi:cation efflux family protein [Klebsormidium nitens]|uniref:Cation efflux family protein n=1 Tax=Klebsormidium nitens TaxID=105231 RepID=A0A1Y1I575_KLENI|nr:cation efflux family protein [Klebsormidium nitens]|eukprot:GAQ86100.1 cation efflux family protein [Klebsormidium nitens]
MAFLRPSFLLPGRYIRCFLLSGPGLDNVHILARPASNDGETDCDPAAPIAGVPRMAARPAPAAGQHWVHAGRAAGQDWRQHAYHSRSSPLPLIGAHRGVVQRDDEIVGSGGGQARSGTAFQGAPSTMFPKAPGWPSVGRVRTHMGHSHDHAAHEPVTSEGEKVVRLGFWSDIGLTIGKAGAGYISGSTAMLADAAHSFSDIALSGVSWWSVRAAAVPKDKEHPYGHGKYESLGAFGVSVLLIATGAGIAWNALEALQAAMGPALALAASSLPDALSAAQAAVTSGHDHGGHSHAIDTGNLGVALAAALLSIGVKEGLYWRTKAVGEQTGSQLLMANAWHHRSDALSSLVALVGVGGAYLGVPWLDPVAGMLLAGMIVKAGLDISTNSVKELVDASVPDPVLTSLRDTAMAVPEVKGCHRVRARKMGSNIVGDLTIDVAPFLSVSAAHNVAEVVRLALLRKNPSLVDVIVHVEPDDAAHDDELPPHRASSARSSGNGAGPDWNEAHVESVAGRENAHAHQAVREQEDGLNRHREQLPLQSDVEAQIRERVSSSFPEVVAVTHVTCHFLERGTIARITIQVDPAMTVEAAARLGRQLEADLERSLADVAEADVHLELNSHAPGATPLGASSVTT